MKQDKTVLIFEGPDKSGKDTLIDILRFECPEVTTVNRQFISDEVYAKKFNRGIYLNVPIDIYLAYWSNYYKNFANTAIVLCIADVNTLVQRCLSANDPLCKSKSIEQVHKELENDLEAFKKTTNKYKDMFKILIVDTSKASTEACFNQIKDFINDIKL